MEIWYRERQVEEVAEKLKVTKADIDLVFRNYAAYLQERVNEGRTVKVLNICYLKNKVSGDDDKIETLAYIATEIANSTGMGNVTVSRILSALEDVIIKDICNGVGFSIRGLVRIRVISENREKRVRIKKSTKYNGMPITVVTLGAFRRRVGSYNAR